ncbi:hypothetical protein [Herpetosiphon sp. NSE202]|uniref:hypothetical protein n=1 Tax=Herpetosiphon sp. NSE202 TaxID=3351349 RepID=UPI003626AFB9
MRWKRLVGSLSLLVFLVACNTTLDHDERDAIAPRVLNLEIDDCSISPSREYALIVQMNRPAAEQYQIYSLITKQPIVLPEADKHAYGDPMDWMLGASNDVLIVMPHWLIDLSTATVTDTRKTDPHKTSPWWTTGPRFIKRNRSPDGRYRIVQGQVSLVPLPGGPLITDTIVSVENPVASLCGNAWEPDSRGLYFIDSGYQARAILPGPLRFLEINP